MVDPKTVKAYEEWRWKYLSGVDREGVDRPMAAELQKKEEEKLRADAIKNGTDPQKVDANVLYLQRKYGSHSL
ncbi:MAG: hypothetical protein II938_01310 [Alphaproteobacteria bacterium]|nr:hypothetical protein [Alphaproteobacteria bacterium]